MSLVMSLPVLDVAEGPVLLFVGQRSTWVHFQVTLFLSPESLDSWPPGDSSLGGQVVGGAYIHEMLYKQAHAMGSGTGRPGEGGSPLIQSSLEEVGSWPLNCHHDYLVPCQCTLGSSQSCDVVHHASVVIPPTLHYGSTPNMISLVSMTKLFWRGAFSKDHRYN